MIGSLIDIFWREYLKDHITNKCSKCYNWEKCQNTFMPATEAGAYFIIDTLNALARSIEDKYGVPADEVRTVILDILVTVDIGFRLKKLKDLD